MSDLLASLRHVADLLANPSQYRTPRHTWDPDRRNRNKIRQRDHVAVLPGMLTQLAAMAFPLGVDGDAGGGARQVPRSRPPGHPAAIAAYLDIHHGVVGWSHRFRVPLRETMTGRIRGLVGAAPVQPHAAVVALVGDMHGWLARCEEITGWRVPDTVLTVPCPDDLCGYRTLRVDLEERTVRCMACGARWADQEGNGYGSLGVLARYVTRYRQAAATAADLARADARRRRAAESGREEP